MTNAIQAPQAGGPVFRRRNRPKMLTHSNHCARDRLRATGPANTRPSKAFTLLEIMIAITILSFVLIAIYSSWTAIVRGAKVGLDAAARVQRTRMAMRCLVDSLLSVQMYGANAAYYSFTGEGSGDFSTLSFVARLPASFPQSGLFGDQVARRLTYTVEAGADGQNQLVMYQAPVLADANTQEQPISVVLARGISLFTVDYWGARSNRWTTDWLLTNQLPKMVRVSIGYANNTRSEPEDVITRIVALPAMVIPREYQLVPPLPAGQPPGRPPGAGGPNQPPGGQPPPLLPPGAPGGSPIRRF